MSIAYPRMSFQADDFQAGASAASTRRAGPSRVSIEEQVPEFGPGQLIGEIDCQFPPPLNPKP